MKGVDILKCNGLFRFYFHVYVMEIHGTLFVSSI